MPLNKLDNFIKNTEGRILYVSPSDLDATDSINNQGNSLAQPFKTLQRALLESARFSYIQGNSNDLVEKTSILLMPGIHEVDNRPGFTVKDDGGVAKVISPGGGETAASDTLNLQLDSNFDINQEDNILYKFNSVNGGVIIPRGTSVIGLDLRKTKVRPKYVPNPTDLSVANSAIFRITGTCYFWQFSFFDGDDAGVVYTDPVDFSVDNRSKPTFSHHKLTCFEYADGVNNVSGYDLTDLDMYYAKLSNAYNQASGRIIDQKYPANPQGFEKQRPEWEIVGAFASDPLEISAIVSGSGGTPTSVVTVTTATDHELQAGTPIKIKGVSPDDYNISTKVQSVSADNPKVFTYLLPDFRKNLETPGNTSSATVTIETDTVTGASPYIFNISLRSVFGMNGMKADGAKASGFRSMVVAQFTGVSLQKDDRAFVKYSKSNRTYEGIGVGKVTGSALSTQSSSTNASTVYHLDSGAVYRKDWETTHISMVNDAILQIVSVFAIGYAKHFFADTGGDASITNSNSNFGQLALISAGFKKDAFAKDNKGFVTNIIAPRAITSLEENIDWQTIDVGVTTSVANNKRLYLFGFTEADIKPSILTQGFRVGAKVGDVLNVDFSAVTGYGTSEASILMSDEETSSVKEYRVISGPTSNEFTIGAHNLSTGEKIIIKSHDADLPENLAPERTYFVIDSGDNNKIKVASSYAASINGTPITVYGGTNLVILSRVSDKDAGDIGHPVQYDSTVGVKQWYINTNAGSDIYNALTQVGVQTNNGLDARTEVSFLKRISDTRSLDEKIYKLRVVVPKEVSNGKNPESGFILQESSTTGLRTDADASLSSITIDDYDFNKNSRFIGSCTFSGGTVTVRSELPHNVSVGDVIITKNIQDTSNTVGTANSGYNGTFTVVSIPNDMEFTYETGASLGPALTNNLTNRTTSLPRYEVNDLQNKLFVYRNEIITDYIQDVQDGIYHLYALNANLSVPTEFTNYEYNQNVVDLYPQLDRDNVDDNPQSAKSFALRAPLGEVQTNDLKKSITKESTDSFNKKFRKNLELSTESDLSVVAGIATLTFTRNHGLSGIVTHEGAITGGSGHTNGTFYNVKLFNEVGLSSWNGATAIVGVSGGAVVSMDIQSSGSGYLSGATLFFDTAVIGGSANATITVAQRGLSASGLSTTDGAVVQVTGIGTTAFGLYRTSGIPSKNEVSIAKTAGDPESIPGQYVYIVAPTGKVSSNSYNSTTGIQQFNCSTPHGLVAGSRFRVLDSGNNNLGDYLVKSRVGVNTFTATTNSSLSAQYVLKHGMSSNEGISDPTEENIDARGVSLFDTESLTLGGFNGDTKLQVSSPHSGIATTKRFPLGSYLQVDEEIMRVVTDTITGTGSNEITVARGALGTGISTHDSGSLLNKVNPIAIEFRRPSIIRASGHTFEYLGYGPGNYSTGLPQVQDRTLTETEEFLSQAQERRGGIVVYTGMNNKGDFYIGNRRTSSSTGEEKTYDIPVSTVTGEDPSSLSVVFDEVIVKNNLVVEGGDSGQILSQFDGPVTFNEEVTFKDNLTAKGPVKIANGTQSTTKTNGALIVDGGAGIGKNLNVGGDLNVDGSISIDNNITGVGATFGNIQIAITNDNTIDTSTGDLILNSASGEVEINDNLDLNGTLNVSSTSIFAGQAVFNTGIVPDVSEGAYLGTAALPWSEARIGDVVIANDSGGGDNIITTVSGNLILNSTDGTVNITDNLDVDFALHVDGTSQFDNNVNMSSNLTVASILDVNGRADIDNVRIDGNTVSTTSDKLILDSTSGEVEINDNLDLNGTLNVSSTSTLGGNTAITGTLTVTDDITAFFSSDERLKLNITPIENPLAKVRSISGNTFTWIEGGVHEGEDTGVIAQEIAALGLPGLTTIRETGYMAVKYDKLTALLIEAVKELSAKVEILEQKLSDK
jgi:hypothetical protein